MTAIPWPGAKVVALVVEDELAEELMAGVEAIVVLDKTPFYAEMGGQVADHGIITCGGAKSSRSTTSRRTRAASSCTTARWSPARSRWGTTVTASIDAERRKAVRRAHSATHLLDAALKKVLGDHVHQAGSLVEPDRLRFDFTHFEAITPEQLAQVDKLVNDAILEGYPCGDGGAAHRGGQEEGRCGHVRREVRRHGPRGGDGRRAPWSSAAAPMWITPPRWVPSASRARHPWPPVSAGSRPPWAQLTLDTINRNQQVLFHVAQMLKTNPGELENRLEQQMNEMK